MNTVNSTDHICLLNELFTWQTKNPFKITCLGNHVLDDGRLLLDLSVNDYKFQLFCPSGYPKYEDNFYVTANNVKIWCHVLNDFLLDSSKKPLLHVILSKIIFLQNSSDNSSNLSATESESESEDEYDEEQNYTPIDTKRENWDSMIWKKKSQWRVKESELRLKLNHPKMSDMFDSLSIDHPKQFFSNSATSEVLINDLINTMKCGKDIGIEVNAIDNNIFNWSVFLTQFNPSSQVARDLIKINELYGYNQIEVQLNFKLNQYPFNPPLVQFIRPKVKSTTIKNLYGLNLLKLDHWVPTRGMMCVLQQIKGYLETFGSININDERNDALKYPNGAYMSIEKHCLQLTAVIEMTSTNIPKITDSYGSDKMKNPFPNGVGYAPDDAKIWHKRDVLIEERERNMQIGTVLKKILNDLTQFKTYTNASSEDDVYCTVDDLYSSFTFPLTNRDTNKNVMLEAENLSSNATTFEQLSAKQKKYKMNIPEHNKMECNIIVNPIFVPESQDFNEPNEELPIVNNTAITRSERVKYVVHNRLSKDEFDQIENDNGPCFLDNNQQSSRNTVSSASSLDIESSNNQYYIKILPIINESPLISLIKSKLNICTFIEMSQHKRMYMCIIEILRQFAGNSNFHSLLGKRSREDESIEDIMKKQEANAKDVLTNLHKATGDRNLLNVIKFGRDEQLAHDIISVSRLIQNKLKSFSVCNSAKEYSTDSESSSSFKYYIPSNYYHENEELSEIYKGTLKPLQFYSTDINIDTHLFKAVYRATYKDTPRKYFLRLAQEFTTLSTSLPLELSSGIFVRIDDSKYTVLRALIIGPKDTPYSGGCFGFDIFLDPNYPREPPLIMCTTPGDGVDHINPNIYPCGRLCLSLLNTWFGHGGEIWTVDSTILQLLISIQSLIFVDEPYFNDPLVQNTRGTKDGTELSNNYNNKIVPKIIQYAMINQIRNPTPGFEDVIQAHFAIKRRLILFELNKWRLRNSLRKLLKAELNRVRLPN